MVRSIRHNDVSGSRRLLRSWHLRYRAAGLLLFLLVAPIAGFAQQGRAPRQLDEGAVRVSLVGVAKQDLMSGFAGDTLFLPLAELCEFLQFEFRATVDLDSIVISTAGRPTALLLPNVAMVVGPEGPRSIDANLISIVDQQILVEAGLAQRLLGITGQWNSRRLELEIAPDATLPVIINARAEKKYASLKLSRARNEAAVLPVDRPAFGDMTLNWSLGGVTAGDMLSGNGMLQLGGPFLFGTLDVRGDVAYQPLASERLLPSMRSARWQFLLPGSTMLNRISMEGRQERDYATYMMELSNTPLPFRRNFVEDSVRGVTEPGWVVEMYNGGVLTSVQRTDSTGAYTFPLDLRYGSNMVEIQEVSPYGERRIRRADAIVRPTMVPPGSLDYSTVAGVRDPLGDRRVLGQTRTRTGITSWLTIGADATLRPSIADQIGWDSIATVSMADLWLGGSAYVNMRYSSIDGIVAAQFNDQLGINTTLNLALDQYQPKTGLVRGSFFLGSAIGSWRASVAASAETRSGHFDGDLMAALSGQLWGFNLSAISRLRAESAMATADAGSLSWAHSGTSLQVMRPLYKSLMLRGRAELNDQLARPSQLEIGASTYLFGGAYLSAGYVVDSMKWKTGRLQAQISVDLNPARLFMTSDYVNGRAVSMANASGSLVVGPSGVIASSYGSMDQSTIVVVGFVDDNGNGRRDNGERSLGRVSATLYSDGYRVADRSSLYPGLGSSMEYMLEVDLWSHVDEGLYPCRQRVSIYTLPATLHEIEIPFATGFDVFGQCELELSNGQRRTSAASFNGLRIQLVEVGAQTENSRQAVYEGEIFQDGSISVVGVAAGEYRVEFDAGQLSSRSLNLRSLPEKVTISQSQTELPAIVFGAHSQVQPPMRPN